MSYSISVPGDDDATTTDLNRCLPINLREKTGGAGNLNPLRTLLILKPVLLLILKADKQGIMDSRWLPPPPQSSLTAPPLPDSCLYCSNLLLTNLLSQIGFSKLKKLKLNKSLQKSFKRNSLTLKINIFWKTRYTEANMKQENLEVKVKHNVKSSC